MGSEEERDDGINFGVSRKIMFAAIASLLGVVVVIILLHLYARYLLKRQERRRRAAAAIHSQRAQIAPIDGSSIIELPPTKSSGLDPSVIASLPTFTYKVTTTANHQVDDDEDHEECSVCLGATEAESTVRLLPNCKHMFHVECIDMWLGSHTTCPICRTQAEPMVQQQEDKDLGARVQPTAPPIEENVSHGSGSRFGSFRRMMMLGRDRSSSRIRSCGDEIATQDLERQ
ncbi:Zinc finger, RING-type [Corchorus capsularis]|uniref:RING-type E3 ubiquitin transferase n=1 Tax=Corchorus capsularis TaxID=210143 RepID=A0A1R3I153_COCAP|nr:Zinc finger, RING-type [Corchorus capsularis]